MIKNINVAEVEYLAFKLAKESMGFNEPIPDFSTRFPNALERCLAAPYQTFGSKYLYRGLVGKASILFYSMIKNHPFQNGNKRIAMTTLLTFLYFNNKWISIDNQSLYNFTIWIASSPSEASTHVIQAIADFLKKYTKNLKQ